MNAALPIPLDVRLMNVTASLLVTGLVLACLGLGLWWAARNPAFAISHITVTGDTEHTSAASLSAAVMPRLAGNFFTMDLAAAQQAFQSAPWVRRALVQREFPGLLHVTLQEHVPVARWGEGDTHLVNHFGEVFEADASDVDGASVPRLVGPEGHAVQLLEMHQRLGQALAPLGTRLATLTLQPRGDWRAELDSGAEIELGQGTPAELSARVAQFAATVGEVAARHQRGVESVEAADLRHVGGYALRLRGVATVRGGAAANTPAAARGAGATRAASGRR
ncbi:MAG: cell division protein FtsQ/DivIB [Pseudomonadota bacterium]|nr:cell division protein FtsQ/DivIB [Pseudomonadota bacterium]